MEFSDRSEGGDLTNKVHSVSKRCNTFCCILPSAKPHGQHVAFVVKEGGRSQKFIFRIWNFEVLTRERQEGVKLTATFYSRKMAC